MPSRPSRAIALLLSYLAFVSLGLPDGLLGVAWPSIRETFALPLDALGALLVSTTAGYVTSSFVSGPILARMNLGMLLAASAGATATSLFAYTLAPSWAVMIAFGTLAGLGAGAIDAGLNAFVAAHYSARTLNMLHAFYGLGTTAGPLIMTTVLMASRPWQRGYAIVAGAQVALALAFLGTRSMWPVATSQSDASAARAAPLSSTLRRPAAWVGIAAFAVYVGLEAAAGAWVYTFLSEARGWSMGSAGTSVSVFWGGLMSGRVVVGLLPEARHPHRLLRGAVATAGAAAGALTLDAGELVGLGAVAALGFACGPIFPSLMATTSARVGAEHAPNAVGMQVAAAALGQSLLPALIGILARRMDLEVIPVCILLSGVALLVLCELAPVAHAQRCGRVAREPVAQ
jgi:fucose permease